MVHFGTEDHRRMLLELPPYHRPPNRLTRAEQDEAHRLAEKSESPELGLLLRWYSVLPFTVRPTLVELIRVRLEGGGE
jgi:hypothetical protein